MGLDYYKAQTIVVGTRKVDITLVVQYVEFLGDGFRIHDFSGGKLMISESSLLPKDLHHNHVVISVSGNGFSFYQKNLILLALRKFQVVVM